MDTNIPLPLQCIKELIKNAGIHALLLRSTDNYFNEYVPEYLSARAYVTGFNGSVGDALIMNDSAHLFVDGRYELQAKSQAQDFTTHVSHSHQSIEQAWLAFIAQHLKKEQSLAFDPTTVNLSLYDRLFEQCQKVGVKLSPLGQTIIAEATKMRQKPPSRATKTWGLPLELSGEHTSSKLKRLKDEFKRLGINGFLAVKLDDIAWLLNIRSNFFPFQSTLPALAIILEDCILISPAEDLSIPKEALSDEVKMVDKSELFSLLSAMPSMLLGVDEQETSKAHEMALHAAGIQIKRILNPLAPMKAIKNGQELLLMRRSFRKADQVVYQTQNFVIQSYAKGEALSEGNIDDYLKEQFFASGAEELSFRPICAAGKNGAIIHYGTPHRKEKVEQGSLFLLDTGAYYQGGYATDLTRTFLTAPQESKASGWQKEMFTLVLKASIRGLSARFRRGLIGQQLDAMVRAPLWQAGVDYAHGTGHGIGINVHEFPPRIGPTSQSELKEHQIFSIEPGIYIAGLGGVRIENLATIVPDPKDANFLCILPLTFCPLDQRLIEQSMLDSQEEEFLRYFEAEWHNEAAMPNLPPARKASFIGK